MGIDQFDLIAQIKRMLFADKKIPRLTVAEIAAQYLASPEFAALAARDTEARRWRCHLLPHLGAMIAVDLDATTLGWYRDQRRAEMNLNGKKNPCSAATRNREITQLSACLTWAVGKRLLTVNAVRGATMEEEPRMGRVPPTAEDVDRLLDACVPRLRAMLAITFGSGVGRAEICALTVDEVMFEDGEIFLRSRDKAGHSRVTVLPTRNAMILRRYLDSRPINSPLLFCTARGRPISPRNFTRDFNAACARAGFDGWRLRDLKVGFIHHQLELGTPKAAVKLMSGVRSIDRQLVREAKARADAFDAKAKGGGTDGGKKKSSEKMP